MRNGIRKIIALLLSKQAPLVLSAVLVAGGVGGAYTYSRYISTASGSSTAQVAKWAVKFNGGVATENKLNILFRETANNNVMDGRIAPASKLHADFEIDPAGSEVAIDYSFKLGNLGSGAPSSLKVEKVCKVVGDKETELTADGDEYKGEIVLSNQGSALTQNDKVTIRVYIIWENDEANNAADTTVGISAPALTLPVTVTAKQRI